MLGIGGSSRFWGEYVKDDHVPLIFSAADVVPCPIDKITARSAAWFIKPLALES